MNSDCKGRRHFKPDRRLLTSFVYAWRGVLRGVTGERNLKIHVTAAVLVMIFAAVFQLSATEWLFILFAVGGVISLELMNTAVEKVVDLVTDEYHPLAEQAKDLAAGAVFIYAVLSVIVGLIIFVPKILRSLARASNSSNPGFGFIN